jgi:hypothetical protein
LLEITEFYLIGSALVKGLILGERTRMIRKERRLMTIGGMMGGGGPPGGVI